MKYESNWKNKSIESLEKDSWSDKNLKDESRLVQNIHRLRKKQIKEFSIEDLRFMIGQGVGLKYLMPIALEELEKDILAEGDFYEGDLLNSILQSDKEYWKSDKDNLLRVCELFETNKQILEEYDTSREIRRNWFTGYEELKALVKK